MLPAATQGTKQGLCFPTLTDTKSEKMSEYQVTNSPQAMHKQMNV
jgi:hypothetical protein